MKFKRFLERNGIHVETWVTVFWILVIIAVLVALSSCGATYHYQKFIDKGGHIEYENNCTADSAKINVIMPLPKWQFRLENRRFRDSMSAVLLFGKLEYKRYQDSVTLAEKAMKKASKNAIVDSKQDGKTDRTKIRQGEKTDRASINQDGKTDRVQIKQTNKTERRKSNWFVWVVIGMLIKPTVNLIYRKARDGLIRWR